VILKGGNSYWFHAKAGIPSVPATTVLPHPKTTNRASESRLSDIHGTDEIRRGRECAPATNELCLRLAVLRRYVATLGTLAAGVLWCYRDKQTAWPQRFVFQLAAQLERAGEAADLPEILAGWTLRFNAHADGQGYDVRLQDTTARLYGYAAFTDESGAIWQGEPFQ
jgi:hypothetical protein